MTAPNTHRPPPAPVSWMRRRPDLARGVVFHLAIFLAAMLVLYLVNSSTRGAGDGWWVIWPLQIWLVAWGFHLWGVTLALHADGS